MLTYADQSPSSNVRATATASDRLPSKRCAEAERCPDDEWKQQIGVVDLGRERAGQHSPESELRGHRRSHAQQHYFPQAASVLLECASCRPSQEDRSDDQGAEQITGPPHCDGTGEP